MSPLVYLLACCAALCLVLMVHLHTRLQKHVLARDASSSDGRAAAGPVRGRRANGTGRRGPDRPKRPAAGIGIGTGAHPGPERRRPGRDVTGARPEEGVRGGGSACLLVNDENPRLPEWLAYHYQTLPLRHLTVAVDPASRSSPSEILGRWEGMIDVQVWGEEDYLPESDGRGRIGRGPCDAGDPKVRGA